MVTAMKDSILTVLEKAEVCTGTQTEKSMMENGLTILNMESAEKLMINLVSTTATGKMVKGMEKEYFITKTEIFTQAGGNSEKKKALVPILFSQLE